MTLLKANMSKTRRKMTLMEAKMSKMRRKITLLEANMSKTRRKIALIEANVSKTRRKMTLLRANMSETRRKRCKPSTMPIGVRWPILGSTSSMHLSLWLLLPNMFGVHPRDHFLLLDPPLLSANGSEYL